MTNTPKPEALEPCPFCGGEAHSQFHQLEETWSIHCRACPAEMPYVGLTEAGAITAWNTRASAVPVKNEALASLVERLRKPTDTDGLWDAMMRQRKETRSDLPRMNMENTIDLLDEERTEAAATLEALAADLCAKIAQNSELAAERDALRHILEAITAMQALRYGDATRTHMALIGLCVTARATLNGAPQP